MIRSARSARLGPLLFLGALGLPLLARGALAQESLPWDLYHPSTKSTPPDGMVGEFVDCYIPLPTTYNFGATEADTIPGITTFLVGELFSPYRVFQIDEDCNLVTSWSTSVAGATMTGLAYDGPSATYWAVDPSSGTVDQYFLLTGVPTGNTCPLPTGGSGAWGPACFDYNQATLPLYVEDIVDDRIVEMGLQNCTVGCSFQNPDDTGNGCYGNGIDDAVVPSSCAGASLVVSSGKISEGQTVRVSQTDCSGTLCYDTWDIKTPLAPYNEVFVNGIVEFRSFDPCYPLKLLAVGTSTDRAYILHKNPSGPNCVTPPLGIRGWWTLDDGQAIDHEGCSDGIPVGSPLPIQGMVHCALEFNGATDYVQVPAASCLDVGFGKACAPNLFTLGGGSFTIEGWIRTASSSGFQPIVDRLGFRGYQLALSNGVPVFTQMTPCMQLSFFGATQVADGQWHHIAVTVRRPPWAIQVGRIFVDGVVDAVFTPPKGSVGGPQDLLLATNQAHSFFYQGDLDEITFYARALTPAEIAAIAAAGSDGKCK